MAAPLHLTGLSCFQFKNGVVSPQASLSCSTKNLTGSKSQSISIFSSSASNLTVEFCQKVNKSLQIRRRREEIVETTSRRRRRAVISAALPPLDLTEDNVRQVLADARTVFAQIFDPSVGITGEVELCEVDGPFVKISLRGRFWHERSLVLARLGNYLKQRIPEILEVDIEDEKQLDDSPENF